MKDRDLAAMQIVGILVYATIYIVSTLVLAVVLHQPILACAAIASAGVSYLCLLMQLTWPDQRVAAGALCVASIACGLFAGIGVLLAAILQ